MRPASRTAISSTSASVSSRWAITIAVRPSSSRRVAAATRASVAGSRRLDASSSTTTSGRARNARASASELALAGRQARAPSRWASSPPGSAASHGPRPTSSSTARSRSSPAGRAPNRVRLSRTDRPEQVDVLGDDRDPGPEGGDGEVAHVDAADPDRAGVHVPEPQDETAERRLAAAGPADDAEVAARRQVQVGGDQGGLPVRPVGERDAVEVDRQRPGREGGPVARPVDDRRARWRAGSTPAGRRPSPSGTP